MLPIQQKFVNYNFSKRSERPQYICIHDTANNGGTALNHYNYFNGGNRNSSADYFIDSHNIIQIVDTDKNYSWAVGDGKGRYGITNNNSVSIEICLESNGHYTSETLKNVLDLTKFLMEKYNIPFNRVVRHYDASRKNCPNTMSYGGWKGWLEFKDKLEGKIVEDRPTIENSNNSEGLKPNDILTTKNVSNTLNLRSEGTTNSKILATINKNDTFIYNYVDSRWLGWLCVNYNGTNGFVSAEYVQKDNKIYNGQVVNVSSSLNVRNYIEGDVIGFLNPNEKVQIISEEKGWYLVKYDTSKGSLTKQGYVSSKYIKRI